MEKRRKRRNEGEEREIEKVMEGKEKDEEREVLKRGKKVKYWEEILKVCMSSGCTWETRRDTFSTKMHIFCRCFLVHFQGRSFSSLWAILSSVGSEY